MLGDVSVVWGLWAVLSW